MGVDFDFSRLDAQDALDIAVYIEEEAQEHYEQVSSWMAAHASQETADFFRRLAKWEAGHARQLTERRKALFGDAKARYTRDIVEGVEAPDYDTLGLDLSRKEALKVAIAAEQRAYDYYDKALEYASQPEVVELFESLRAAEVDHKRILSDELAKLEAS